jgi:hypothetical protein
MLGLVLLLGTPGIANADTPFKPASNQQYIDLVIQRGLSQRGVPFVYGGGNANPKLRRFLTGNWDVT